MLAFNLNDHIIATAIGSIVCGFYCLYMGGAFMGPLKVY